MSAGSEFHSCSVAYEKAKAVVHAGSCNSGQFDSAQ